MSVNFDRKTLRSIARKTLGREENDNQAISPVYITHLRHFLSRYPDEQSFTIELDTGDGSTFCRVCECRVPPGEGEPEEDGKDIFGSLNNLEEHAKMPSHQRMKALKLNDNQSAMDTGKDAYPSSSSCQLIDLTESCSRPSIRNASSGLSISKKVQEVDEDFLLALKLDEELNGPRHDVGDGLPRHTALSYGLMDVDDIEQSNQPVSPHEAINYLPSQDGSEELREDFPFEETYHAQILRILSSIPGENPLSCKIYRENHDEIQARCTVCHHSVALPGSGSFDVCLDDVTEGLAAYEEHLKSPHHLRKRDEMRAQASDQHSSAAPPPQPHVQSTPSIPYTALSTLNGTKRRLPGGWYDFDETSRAENDGNSDHFASGGHGFMPASAVRDAIWNPSPQGIVRDYRLCSPPRRPNLQIQNNFVSEGSASQTARDIAIRQFEESQVATFGAYGSHRGMNAEDFDISYDEGDPVIGNSCGPDLDKQFKEFMNKALEEFKDVATVTDAQKELGMRSENDLLDGMQVPLLPHQIIGVAWMVNQEKDKGKRGGILADAMGLGKTVQMIATMVLNCPPRRLGQQNFFERQELGKGKGKGKSKETEHERRTTLVLAPASLLQQWYEELNDKTAPGTFRVHIHHGKDKLKTVTDIENYDVIIASHQSVIGDFPKEKKKYDAAVSEDEDDGFSELRTLGPLAKVQWLRVVIDEAQSIRNKATRLSTCVARLDAHYRWCLTGTPITNSLADIYGFLRFCRFSPWDDWKLFNQNVARMQKKQPARAGRKAQAILKPHLLRRTKDSTLDGRPIIRLGLKTIDMIELEFTREEREIYASVETAQKKIVSRFLKEGSVMKNYSYILVMILRLRQICCHPKLATTEGDAEQLDADQQRAELIRATQMIGAHKVRELKERIKARVLDRMKVEMGLVKATGDEDEGCPICLEPIVEDRRVTSCAHEFCSVCINEVLQKAEGQRGEDAARCPLCRSALDRKHIFVGQIFEPTSEELEKLESELQGDSTDDFISERPSKKQRRDTFLEGAADGNTNDLGAKTALVKDDVEPSTKMKCLLDSILSWKTEHPGDKTIIYSQWTSMLDLVETYLKGAGVEALRYDGRMNRMARVESVVRFKKPSGPSVMLVSLKCGGVGLNLTMANRVVNLDLAWNYATEAQAYDRVHRLGQQKPVEIRRLVIRDTIEERIIRLQAKKQGLSDAALGEGTGSKLQRLTARDIAELFDLK